MIATPELMSDPDFVRNITLRRPTATMSGGEERTTHLDSTIKAHVEPASTAQVNLLPEGARERRYLAVYSATEVRATAGAQDIVVVSGTSYRAVQSETWEGSYFLAICEAFESVMSNLMEDTNAQIRRLIERVLGLSEGYMRPSHQRANAGKQNDPYGTVYLMTGDNQGWASRSVEDDGAGGLLEVVEAPFQVVASVQFFKNAPRPADLRGGEISSDVADYTGVTAGAFSLPIDGASRSVTGLDLSTCTTMAEVAAAVQAKLAAALGGVTVAWTGKRLVVTSPTTGQSSAVGVAPVSATATLLGLTSAAGASPSDNLTGLAKPGLDAVELARRLTTRIQLGQFADQMRTLGLGYLGKGLVRDLSFVTDANYESRASVDLTFLVSARETAPVGALEQGSVGILYQAPGDGPEDITNIPLEVTT